jgi:uncharacterized protein (DUF1501 family)
MALPSSSLPPIGWAILAMHEATRCIPALPEVQNLYSEGKLAFLANVGTLVQPTSLARYQTGTGLPPQLFSHSNQRVRWQSSVRDPPCRTGRGRRMADTLNAMNANNQISMLMGLYGANFSQVGQTVANWFGVSATNLTMGPPNFGPFGVPNLGLLG